MTRSMYLSCDSSPCISARDETDWMNVGGIGVGSRAEEMRDESIVAVWMDSLPPFRMAALPAYQQRLFQFMIGLPFTSS